MTFANTSFAEATKQNRNTVMKTKNKIITTCLTAAGLLAVATFVSIEQKTFAQAPPDPAHAAHLAAASGQPAGQVGGQSVE